MAKATKPHYQKKNNASSGRWRQSKKDNNSADVASKLRQRKWRIACLQTRKELTEKNKKEVDRLFEKA